MRAVSWVVLALELLALPTVTGAVEYVCDVTKKVHTDEVYTAAHIKKAKFSVRLEDDGSVAFLSRCSFSSSEGAVTCDRYVVERIEYDEAGRAKKYYVFKFQYDVQVFGDLTFIENNGRGSIGFGKCRVVARSEHPHD